MKKIIFQSLFCIAQNPTDSISVKKSSMDSISIVKKSGVNQFYQGTKKLKLSEMAILFSNNTQASGQLQSARDFKGMAHVFSFAGGLCLGWEFAKLIKNRKEISPLISGIGAGLVIIGISINESSIKKSKEAVNTYNEGLRKKTTSIWQNSELKIVGCQRGIGLSLSF
jgi:hypothetical protein